MKMSITLKIEGFELQEKGYREGNQFEESRKVGSFDFECSAEMEPGEVKDCLEVIGQAVRDNFERAMHRDEMRHRERCMEHETEMANRK